MNELIAAFQFLTIIPPLIQRPFTHKELGRSVGLYPIVGLAIGGVLVGMDSVLSSIFPSSVRAALVLCFWVVLTRAIHLDGFLDACDGMFGGFTPKKRLMIMRDSRIGAFALIGGVLVLISIYSSILTSQDLMASLLLAPVLGRWSMSFAVVSFPYARPEGMGRTMKDNSSWKELMIASLTAFAAAWFIGQFLGLVMFGLIVLISFLGLRFVLRLIPGLTGDIYGAACISVELLILLIFSAIPG